MNNGLQKIAARGKFLTQLLDKARETLKTPTPLGPQGQKTKVVSDYLSKLFSDDFKNRLPVAVRGSREAKGQAMVGSDLKSELKKLLGMKERASSNPGKMPRPFPALPIKDLTPDLDDLDIPQAKWNKKPHTLSKGEHNPWRNNELQGKSKSGSNPPEPTKTDDRFGKKIKKNIADRKRWSK